MEKRILVCMPVDGTPAENVVSGSLLTICDECGADIWATKASIVYSGGKKLICLPCFDQAKETEIEIMRPSEGQIREIEQHFRKED